MNKASAQLRWIYPATMIALAACAAWTLMDLVAYGANAGDLLTLAVLALGIVAVYLANREKFLAPAPASSDADERVRADWEPPEFEERAVPRPKLQYLDPPREKEYRQGDWLTFIPAAAKVVDFEQREDGTRWVVYQMPTDYNGARRKSPMTLAPQRAVADTPAVRAEFDSPEPVGLVVEEVGDEDDGYTPFAADQGPGVIGDDTALATVDEGQIGDPAYRRSKIDQVRRKRHNAHWLAEAERTGKLPGAADAYLRHILAGADAAPVAQYLEHAKQLVQRAEEGQLMLPATLTTPLGQQLAISTKTAQEGATLALALIETVQKLEEQRDELACRLIQAMPTAIDRKRANSYFESLAEEADEEASDEPLGELVTYTVMDADKLEGVGAHFFPSRAPVLVPLADLHAEGATRLRVIDPVHHGLLGYVYRNPTPVPGASIPD